MSRRRLGNPGNAVSSSCFSGGLACGFAASAWEQSLEVLAYGVACGSGRVFGHPGVVFENRGGYADGEGYDYGPRWRDNGEDGD